jgi:hypothetical protein
VANLDEKFIRKEIEYDILDAFVPLFSLRHLPSIIREKDNFIRKCEISYFTLFNAAQIFMYYHLSN